LLDYNDGDAGGEQADAAADDGAALQQAAEAAAAEVVAAEEAAADGAADGAAGRDAAEAGGEVGASCWQCADSVLTPPWACLVLQLAFSSRHAQAGLLKPACSTYELAVPCVQAKAASPAPARAAASADPDDPLSQPPHGTEVRAEVPSGGACSTTVVASQPCQSVARRLPACCQQTGCAGVASPGLLQHACTHAAVCFCPACVPACRCTLQTWPWKLQRHKSGHWPRQ
jgi:hypothetical protein